MNHLKFAWNNAYDAYSAEALNVVMSDRPDIEAICEPDGMHYRSEGDLQPILDVCVEYEMDFEVLEMLPGFILTAIKPAQTI